jgi:hypothetical protein
MMADSETITLGIGTPATIAAFILFGLGPAPLVVVPVTPAARIYTPEAEDRVYVVEVS